MRCKYCGSIIKIRDEVCKGCSAPVPTVNHASGWGFFFAIISLLFSFFPVFNTPLLLLGLIFSISGILKARKRDGKGRVLAIVSLILILMAIVITVIMMLLYQMQYEMMVDTYRSILTDERQQEIAQKILDIMTLKAFGF